MLILTDCDPASLLMAAEHLRRHELMGRETFTREPDGSFRLFDPQLRVIDVSIALAQDDELLFDAFDDLFAGGGVRELVLTIGQVPPWEREKTENFLKELDRHLGSVSEMEERFGQDFKAVWYVPEKQSTLRKIAGKHKQSIRLETNPFYERVQQHQWLSDPRRTFIEEALFSHIFYREADSKVLTELLMNIVRNRSTGEGEK